MQAQGKRFQHMLKRGDLPQAPPRAGAGCEESGQEPLLDVATNRDFGMVNSGDVNKRGGMFFPPRRNGGTSAAQIYCTWELQ